jgi:hypothetical protein
MEGAPGPRFMQMHAFKANYRKSRGGNGKTAMRFHLAGRCDFCATAVRRTRFTDRWIPVPTNR